MTGYVLALTWTGAVIAAVLLIMIIAVVTRRRRLTASRPDSEIDAALDDVQSQIDRGRRPF